MRSAIFGLGLLLLSSAVAQEYSIYTFAGGAPPPTPADGLTLSIGSPQGIATDSLGNVYFTSLDCVFRQDTNGVVTRIAGTSRPGYSGDDGPATSARLNLEGLGFGRTGGAISPAGVAVDAIGNVFVADVGNHRIRRISPDGIITTVAGNGTSGFSGDGGPATNAQISASGVAVSPDGSLLIADAGNLRIRQVSPDGIIATVAGNGAYDPFAAEKDGVPATNSQVGFPTAIASDAAGNLFITESGTNRIRRVSQGGIITTLAGVGLPRFNCAPSGDGGPAISAQLCEPSGIAIDFAGNVYFADTVADFDGDFRQIVRKISPDGRISTIAGINCDNFCPPFDNDGGAATRALLTGALSLAVDASGRLLIADPLNDRIRAVSPDGSITVVAGGGARPFSDGVPAIIANLFAPAAVASDSLGNVFIADAYSYRIRKVSPDGLITTVAGDGTRGSSGDGGPAIDAQLSEPAVIALDSAGNLFIVDGENNRIRRVSPSGIITTVAGRGAFMPKPGAPCIPSGDGGSATDAQLCYVPAMAADGEGSLFFRDGPNVRKVSKDGTISTLFTGFYGGSPGSLAADKTGNVFVASDAENIIRKVSPDGIVTVVAGNGEQGFFSGDGGFATDAQMTPSAVALDNAGNVFISDCRPGDGGCRIRKVTPDGIVTTIAGDGTDGSAGDGGPALNASISYPATISVDGRGRIFLADRYANVVRVLAPSQ